MSISPETKLIQKIHRQTDKYKKANAHLIFKQKMNMMPGGISGIPDYYYEANPGQLWVEYKYIKKWQGKRTMPTNKITDNQLTWLRRAVSNKRNCAVIIGDETGLCAILKDEEIFTPPTIQSVKLITPPEVAKWIAQQLMYTNFKELK